MLISLRYPAAQEISFFPVWCTVLAGVQVAVYGGMLQVVCRSCACCICQRDMCTICPGGISLYPDDASTCLTTCHSIPLKFPEISQCLVCLQDETRSSFCDKMAMR